MKVLTLLFLCLPLIGAKEKIPPNPTAQGIVQAFEVSWAKISTYKASYQQETETMGIPGAVKASGTIFISKPDKFRTDLLSDNSIQILQPKKFIQIQENEGRGSRTVDIIEKFDDSVVAKPLKILTGELGLSKVYKSRLVSTGTQSYRVELTSKKMVGDRLVAEFDKSSYLLRSLMMEDPASKVKITFSEIETNPKLDDSLFEYQEKQGDVVNRS